MTIKQGQALVQTGVITQDAYDEMVEQGLIAEGKRKSSLPIMYTEDGTKTFPSLVFRGGRSGEMSKRMRAFRQEFDALCDKYDETIHHLDEETAQDVLREFMDRFDRPYTQFFENEPLKYFKGAARWVNNFWELDLNLRETWN